MPTATINDHAMYYEIHGSGEPVLSIGGFPLQTGRGILNQPENLRRRFQYVVFDHRGLGGSELGAAPASTRTYAADAAGLLDHLGLSPVHLLGTGGLGACIAQHIAASRPDLVHDVVLSAGWVRPEPYHHAQQELMALLRRLDDLTAYNLFANLLSVRPEHFKPEILSGLHGASGSSGWQDRALAHGALQKANYEHDASDVLGSIRCPTLVTCGEHDPLAGPRLARALADAIPGSRFTPIPNVAHVLRVDPAAQLYFGVLIESFFSEHPLDQSPLPSGA